MIQIGQRVYSGLYGGRYGVVYAIHGEQRPQTVGGIAGILRIGGNAEFDIVFDDGTETHKLPETILYGVQWNIHDEVVSTDEIKRMREFCASEMAREEVEAKKIAEEFKAAVDALRANPEFTALQQTRPENKAHGGKLVTINVRRQLKSAFSDVKFSVTGNYDNLSVKWTDGPTTAQVEAITMKYKSGYSDGMSDMCYKLLGRTGIGGGWALLHGRAQPGYRLCSGGRCNPCPGHRRHRVAHELV